MWPRVTPAEDGHPLKWQETQIKNNTVRIQNRWPDQINSAGKGQPCSVRQGSHSWTPMDSNSNLLTSKSSPFLVKRQQTLKWQNSQHGVHTAWGKHTSLWNLKFQPETSSRSRIWGHTPWRGLTVSVFTSTVKSTCYHLGAGGQGNCIRTFYCGRWTRLCEVVKN